MNKVKTNQQESDFHMNPLSKKDAFLRLDENDDSLFYSKDRFVSHLDSFSQTTVKKIIGELMESMIAEVESPIVVHEILGDAISLYAIDDGSPDLANKIYIQLKFSVIN